MTTALGKFTVPLASPPRAFSLLSKPLLVANLFVVVATNVAFALLLPRLPAAVPTNWRWRGEVNAWGPPHGLWSFDFAMTSNLAVIALVAWMLSLERWALPQAAPERALPLQIAKRRLLLWSVEILMLVSNLLLAANWLFYSKVAAALSAPLMLLSMIFVLRFYLRKQRVIRQELRALGAEPALGTQTNAWHFYRLIYFAPDDPALFVPKARGYGLTINFARPAALLVLVAVFAVPLAFHCWH